MYSEKRKIAVIVFLMACLLLSVISLGFRYDDTKRLNENWNERKDAFCSEHSTSPDTGIRPTEHNHKKILSSVVPNAKVETLWTDFWWEERTTVDKTGKQIFFGRNSTYTNSTGYFELRVPPGKITLKSHFLGYTVATHVQGATFDVLANQIYWKNLTVNQRENVIVRGFVRNPAGIGIANVNVTLTHGTDRNDTYINWSRTDATGYYEFFAGPGKLNITAFADTYFTSWTGVFNARAHQTLYKNITMISKAPFHTVTVRVTDRNTTCPIPHASVLWQWTDGTHTLPDTFSIYDPAQWKFSAYPQTDMNGVVRFQVPHGGRIATLVVAEMFNRTHFVNYMLGIDVPGDITINLTLRPKIPSNAKFYGHVRDPSGSMFKNISYASVSMMLITLVTPTPPYTVDFIDLNLTRANDTGYFQIDTYKSNITDPGPNTYLISINASAYGYFNQKNHYLDPHTGVPSYPVMGDIVQDIMLSPVPSESSVIRGYVLTEPQPGTVSGRVTDEHTGRPLSDVQVRAYDTDGRLAASTMTNSTGCYALSVLPGTYMLNVTKSGYYPRTVNVIVQEGMETNVNFQLKQLPATVCGTVHDNHARAVSGATVQLYNGETLVNSTLTDADGNYIFSNIRPGTGYRLNSTKPGYRPADLLLPALEPGEILTGQNIVLILLPGRLTGTVTDQATGRPIYHAKLLFSNTQTYTLTDSHGNYTFDNLEPGDYNLIISAHKYRTAYRNVTISAGETVTLNIILERLAGTLTGNITDTDGNPVPDAFIELFSDGSRLKNTTTNSRGEYRLEKIDYGTYTLRISKPGFVAQNVTVSVTGTINYKDVKLARVTPPPHSRVGLELVAVLIAVAILALTMMLVLRRKS